MSVKDLQFDLTGPLYSALGLKPPTETERQLINLQAACLEALTDLERNQPREAWTTLHEALTTE